jgi:toluene monooxygenase system ferredoxin subunit
LVDLGNGKALAVALDGVNVLLCAVDGEVFAYEDRCPHLANPLSNGRISGYVLTCAAHEWAFDIRDGSGIDPVSAELRAFPVRLDGQTVVVDIGASEHGR